MILWSDINKSQWVAIKHYAVTTCSYTPGSLDPDFLDFKRLKQHETTQHCEHLSKYGQVGHQKAHTYCQRNAAPYRPPPRRWGGLVPSQVRPAPHRLRFWASLVVAYVPFKLTTSFLFASNNFNRNHEVQWHLNCGSLICSLHDSKLG